MVTHRKAELALVDGHLAALARGTARFFQIEESHLIVIDSRLVHLIVIDSRLVVVIMIVMVMHVRLDNASVNEDRLKGIDSRLIVAIMLVG